MTRSSPTLSMEKVIYSEAAATPPPHTHTYPLMWCEIWLNDINLCITKNTHVLLNGPSGCGKSTICRLIYGEYDLSKGTIYLGDKNIKDINLYSIRNNILYVSQQEKLFFGTIKENILAGRNVDNNLFDTICKICEIDSIVNKREMRYNALIDPSFNNLSGGEKQRIILARGLLKRSNYLILDEALSEVDKELEEIEEEVKTSAYEIIAKKGATSYGIGMCLVKMTNAILENKNSILPVSSWDEENKICISTPAIVGSDGVKGKIFIPLNESETEKIVNSINTIKEAISKVD